MCAVETNALELHVCNFEHSSVPSAAIFVQGSEGIFFSMGGQKERGKQKGKDGLEQGQKGSNCGLEESQKSDGKGKQVEQGSGNGGLRKGRSKGAMETGGLEQGQGNAQFEAYMASHKRLMEQREQLLDEREKALDWERKCLSTYSSKLDSIAKRLSHQMDELQKAQMEHNVFFLSSFHSSLHGP